MNADDPVHVQYEAYPYPPRDPRDEAKRLVTGSPSHLAEVVHVVFGGVFDPAKPFRALVAGGGTGDAAIMLAQQLRDAGAAAAEVVYVDRSTGSRRIAESRAAMRGLDNLRFVTGSLLELDRLGLRDFDYVDCCGVLHHLEDPAAGLESLVRATRPEGGMGLMLYAPLGRTGVYPVQQALRLLDDRGAPEARVAFARRLLGQLPATNWLKRNPFMTDHVVEGDAGLYDLLLHARDRAYSVDEVHDFVAAAGLRIAAFAPPARYEPRHYLSDPAVLRRAEALDARARAALAEALAGNIKSHAFYVVHRDNPVAPPVPDDLDMIPVAANVDMAQLAKSVGTSGTITATVDGLPFRLPLPRLAGAILQLVDGRRSLADILAMLQARDSRLDETAFRTQIAQIFSSLNALGKLMLRRPLR
jgi:ubiquinone/menaquinone biosynthesis C-methylase UbiE